MNAIIKVNVQRLNFPLATLFARRYSAFRFVITNVPADLSGVFIRIFSGDESSFNDYPAIMALYGNWCFSLPCLAFSDTGYFIYEIHAENDKGEKVALGRGVVNVKPFSAGGAAGSVGTPVVVAKMPTKDGKWVNCWATMDETGEYVYEFEKLEVE